MKHRARLALLLSVAIGATALPNQAPRRADRLPGPCDAEVSADGHNRSMGAYATDYVEKTWPSQYSGRRRLYDYEGQSPIAAPSAGYIWDACRRAGVTYRSYREWVATGSTAEEPSVARVKSLEGHIDPHRGWDLLYSDVDRARRFLAELARFEREGKMPLAVSPYSRKRGVDSTMYSTSSMLRTMELILGIAPMTQYDAAAAPMFRCFGTRSDLAPSTSRPARVSLTDVNAPTAPGTRRSAELDFDQADAAPDLELSEIVWKAVRGASSEMPAPVRTVFVRPIQGREREER